MEGIQFLINDKGIKEAVVLDLKQYGEYWEDIEDILVAYKRRDERKISFKTVKENLKKKVRYNV